MTSNRHVELSDREKEVLILVARGHGSPEIAEALEISEATVRTHVSNVFKKMAVHTRASAVAQAIKRGLIDLDDLD